LAATCQEMQSRGFTSAQIATVEASAATAIHEDLAQCTYVHVDDVEIKKQKAHRDSNYNTVAESAAVEASPPATQQCPKVTTTIACLEQGQKRFRLCGSGVLHVPRFVLAFLLNNALLTGRLHIFTDGHKGLQNAIKTFFA
jgi:hypothetical protein